MALSKKQKDAVKSITIAHAAFVEALIAVETGGYTKALANSIITWGNALKHHQEYLEVPGVYSSGEIDIRVARARMWEAE